MVCEEIPFGGLHKGYSAVVKKVVRSKFIFLLETSVAYTMVYLISGREKWPDHTELWSTLICQVAFLF